jgi:hypothetical protein
MNTEQKINLLAKAIKQLVEDHAFTLRHLSTTEEIRLSDQNRMKQIAERLDQLADEVAELL